MFSLLSFSPCSDGSGLRESIPEKIRLDFFYYINNKVLGEVVSALTPKTFSFVLISLFLLSFSAFLAYNLLISNKSYNFAVEFQKSEK